MSKDIASRELIIKKREANVAAVKMAIDTIRNQAALLRQRIARDEADARVLERDITRAEADLEGWHRGLVVLRQRIEAGSNQLRGLGTQGSR